MTLGGRAAEEIIFGKISTGALSDLERITKMAYSIVSIYGMNEKIGNVSFYDSKASEYRTSKPYSEKTSETIDEEVRKLIGFAYERTKDLLTQRRPELEILAKELLEKEILFQMDLERLIGKRPFEKETTYEAFTKKVDANDKAAAERKLSEEAQAKKDDATSESVEITSQMGENKD